MTLINLVFIASALITFFIAISLLSSRAGKPLCARILGVNYLLSSVQYLLATVVFSGAWPEAAIMRAHFALLLGPALYLYFVSVLDPNALKLKRLWFHLLPLPLMTGALFLPGGLAADFLIVGSFLGYFSFTLFRYRSAVSAADPAMQANKPALRWLSLLLWVMLVNLAVELGIVIELYFGGPARESLSLKVGSLFFLCFQLFALCLVLTRASLFEWMHELKELSGRQPKLPKLSEKELQAIFARWEELVAKKALFLSENGITVSRAAKLLGVPSRQLSQAINTIYGASFSQYLNEQRVELAKRLLQQNLAMPITEI